MSIFWDPYAKRPQLWVYPLFILITIGMVAFSLMYGMKKADEKDRDAAQAQKKIEFK